MKIDILVGMILLEMAVAAPIGRPEQSTVQPPVASNAGHNKAFPEAPAGGQFNTYVLNPSDFGLSLENIRALQALLGAQTSSQSGSSVVTADKQTPTTIFQLYQPVITINHNYVVQPNAIPNQPEEKPSQDKKSKTSISVSDGSINDSQYTSVTGDKTESPFKPLSTTESSLPRESTTSASLTNAIEKAKVHLLNYLLFGYNKDSKAYPSPR